MPEKKNLATCWGKYRTTEAKLPLQKASTPSLDKVLFTQSPTPV